MRIVILILAAVLLFAAGCGNGEEAVDVDEFIGALSLEEKQDLLSTELEVRQVEDIDLGLSETLMAEKEIKFAYVKDQGNVVAAYLTFMPGVSDEAIDRISDLAWDLLEEEYPGRNFNVSGEIAED